VPEVRRIAPAGPATARRSFSSMFSSRKGPKEEGRRTGTEKKEEKWW